MSGDLFGDDAADAAGGAAGDGGNGTPPGWQADGRLRRLIDDNFVRYAAYVIRDRAIPELLDGLKPVQRRILHALRENDDGKFVKVANIVGHTMQYHPHGDASITDALVTLVNKRYLVEGQGNFGNALTGDPAAASRYIECRLTDLARNELFNDELTRFVDSYDGRRKEPVTLPAKLPLLLMMGADGIAVGLSTRVLPHNFVELLQAQIAILRKKPFEVLPDFPHGGLMDATEYARGTGRVRVRGRIEAGDGVVTIRSIPYGTTTDSVIASIETAARKKKLALKSIDDFTASAVEIRVVLKPDQDPQRAVQALYAFTQCEVALSSRIVVIRKGRPVELDVEQVLKHNTRTLVRTLRRQLETERRKLIEQVHDKTLVQLFVEHRVYKRIEECPTWADVQQAVLDGIQPFRERLQRDVTTRDVQMLLGIPIKRISRYDIDKNREEIAGLLMAVERIDTHLAQLTEYAIRYLRDLIKKYGPDYPRRTEIVAFDAIEVRELTADELTLCYDADKGYLGHEVAGDTLLQCSPLDRVLVVRRDGGYRVLNPPDKLFVDVDLKYCAFPDRDRVFVVVYRDEHGMNHVKRFTFGGTILNRDYACIPAECEILFLADDDPQTIYVKYGKHRGVRPDPQAFDLSGVKVRSVKTRGTMLTSRPIESIGTARPRNWTKSPSRPGLLGL